MLDTKTLAEKIKEHFDNLDEKGWEELREFFKDDTPKGWLSIEEYLPHWLACDVEQGYSIYKVRDKDGNEFESPVSDHNTWYYMAKQANITHWLNT